MIFWNFILDTHKGRPVWLFPWQHHIPLHYRLYKYNHPPGHGPRCGALILVPGENICIKTKYFIILYFLVIRKCINNLLNRLMFFSIEIGTLKLMEKYFYIYFSLQARTESRKTSNSTCLRQWVLLYMIRLLSWFDLFNAMTKAENDVKDVLADNVIHWRPVYSLHFNKGGWHLYFWWWFSYPTFLFLTREFYKRRMWIWITSVGWTLKKHTKQRNISTWRAFLPSWGAI